MEKQPGANQQQYLEQQKKESLNQLKPENIDIVNKFIEEHKNAPMGYMLTIARDGESPVRSIYNFHNVIDAVTAYNKYVDWGFAKEYLTITLYGPGGKLAEKNLRRPDGGTQGDCTFIRQDYIEAEKILIKYKNKLIEDEYKQLVNDFAKLFSRDNIRFDVIRFFKECQSEEVFE